MARRRYFTVIFILGMLSTISPFSVDMYLSGFPAIANDLHTSMAQVELSLSAYLIGLSIGQLLYGPLLDRYGRKKPLYIGLGIYMLASIGCACSASVEALIILRLLQALGGCVGMVAAQAFVRDLFPPTQLAQVLSLLILVVAVSPMIAPTIGGYATIAFGWRSIFFILAGITALILVGVYWALPEGRQPDPMLSLRPKAVLQSFYRILKQPQFLIYASVGGIATAASFAYLAGSPDLFMNQYNGSEQEYGFIFAFLAIAMIGPTQLNRVLLKRFTNEQIVDTTLLYQLLVGLALVVGTWGDWYDRNSLIIVLFLFFSGQGLIGPNASALALMPFVRHAGSAVALMGSFRIGFGALVSGAVSMLHNKTAMPMVGMMMLCIVSSLLILFTGQRMIQYQKRRISVDEPIPEGII